MHSHAQVIVLRSFGLIVPLKGSKPPKKTGHNARILEVSDWDNSYYRSRKHLSAG